MPKTSKLSREKKAKIQNRKSNFSFVLGSLLILLSILFLFRFPSLNSSNSSNPIKVDSKLLTKKDANIPVRILIPGIAIDLPVVEAKIINGYWEVSENSASHGEGSAGVGQKGNNVIFAHARPNLFYNLKDVKEGDIVYVFGKEKWRRYKVNKIISVYPNQIETIAPTEKESLTLYTCSGFFDEKRLVVKAIPLD